MPPNKGPLLGHYNGPCWGATMEWVILQQRALAGGLQKPLLEGYNGMGSVPILIPQRGVPLTPPM